MQYIMEWTSTMYDKIVEWYQKQSTNNRVLIRSRYSYGLSNFRVLFRSKKAIGSVLIVLGEILRRFITKILCFSTSINFTSKQNCMINFKSLPIRHAKMH